MHLNVAQRSGPLLRQRGHRWRRARPDARARRRCSSIPALSGPARSPRQLLENAYLKNLDEFLTTGRTPMPCHALRASCFIDPWGVVYPCITYSRPMGRLRDTGMRLDPIWNDARDGTTCSARSGRATARSAGPPARRIRASSATCSRSRRQPTPAVPLTARPRRLAPRREVAR